MNTKLLSISLAMITSMLVACGGGGDARSPDRPNPKIDPTTLRIDFPDVILKNKLPGLGTSKIEEGIPVRLVALQTDGIEFNIGPELNVTDKATWSIEGADTPVLAELSAPVRNAISFGKVKDILSSTFYPEKNPDNTVNPKVKLTVKALFNFEGRDYPVTGEFFVIPPTRIGKPQIIGPDTIAIDPFDPNATATASYQLLQDLAFVEIRENRTGEAMFCAGSVDKDTGGITDKSDIFEFESYDSDQVEAEVVINNPFTNENNQEGIIFTISAIDPDGTCSDLYDERENLTIFASKTVKVEPAKVTSVDVCTIIEPLGNPCNGDGFLETELVEQTLTSCIGLDSATSAITEATVPAASTLQMIAKLHYENPANTDNDQPFDRYRCSAKSYLTWKGVTTDIFMADDLSQNEIDGTATTIPQKIYLENLGTPGKNNSVVTASFRNSTSATPITGSLTVKLTDATVSNVTITPISTKGVLATPATDQEYTINIGGFETEKRFIAICTYSNGTNTAIDAPCADGTVRWTVGSSNVLSATPAVDTITTVKPAIPATPVLGTSFLKATYKNSTALKDIDEVDVTVINDPLVELVLVQADPTERAIDEFSCLGSGNYSLAVSEAGGPAAAFGAASTQQYYAHALFKSQYDSDNPPSRLDLDFYEDVTGLDSIVFSALGGYFNSEDNICVTEPASGAIPQPTPSEQKLAEFSAATKGLLVVNGNPRLGTMCIQVFSDLGGQAGVYDPPRPSTPPLEKETLSKNGSSVLIQPAATAELEAQAVSNCALFEEAINGGAGPRVLPAMFEAGYQSDPVISLLQADDITIEIQPAIDIILE
jgi:hypothetical protein